MVVEDKGDTKGIVVDQVMGKQEVVVQNLRENEWVRSDCVMGGSIMADGRVSLIPDVRSLCAFHEKTMPSVPG